MRLYIIVVYMCACKYLFRAHVLVRAHSLCFGVYVYMICILKLVYVCVHGYMVTEIEAAG